MVYKRTFFPIACLFLIGCAFNTAVKITPVDILVDTETVKVNGNVRHNRNDYFLFDGGVGRKDNTKAAVENFIYLHGDNIKRYDNYHMLFYRKSKELNLQNIQEYHEDTRWKAFVEGKPVFDYFYQGGKLLHVSE